MTERRRLIVNADDFGQSAGVNEGIIRCHEHGILTSASLMVRWPHATAAADYARRHPSLSVGLHIDLGEWVVQPDGGWSERYTVVPTDDAQAVSTEILRQLAVFRRLIGADPTHLDSHQHVHMNAPADRIVRELGAALGVPVRNRSDQVRHVGGFYGAGRHGESLPGLVSVEGLTAIIRALGPGTSEVGCHPGLHRDAGGSYVTEREQEVATLCDPAVRRVIDEEQIELITFRDVAART